MPLIFNVKRNFNIGINLSAFLKISDVFYNIVKDEWTFTCTYFYNKKASDFYDILIKLKNWIHEHPLEINTKNLDKIQQYLNFDKSKLPITVDQVILINQETFNFEEDTQSFHFPLSKENFWYGKTKEEIMAWVREFIIRNKEYFLINEITPAEDEGDGFQSFISGLL